MTYEDAIKTLEVAIAEVEWEYPMEYAAALDMAIKALQAQQEAEKNEPLTLDELREMDGVPVWLVNQNGGRWVIMSGVHLWDNRKNAEYGKTWLAYRRPPKEGKR